MIHSSHMDVPKAGDVIVTRDASRYLVSTSGHAPQMTCATYEDAVAQADRFARAQHVDVWKTDDTRAYLRIVEHRTVASM